MKYIFIVQGEGRGHLTQAITLSRLLRERGHIVGKVMVGKSPSRKIPAFFEKEINAEVEYFESMNFMPSAENRRPSMVRTVMFNSMEMHRFFPSMQRLRDVIRSSGADVVVNFYELMLGMTSFFYGIDVPVVCIGHQYLFLHKDFGLPYMKYPGSAALDFFTKLTSIGCVRHLALSFREMPSDPHHDIVVVPPLLREEVLGMEASQGDYIHGYMLNSGFAKDVKEWHEMHPDVPLRFFWDNWETEKVTKIDDTLTFYQLDDKEFLRQMAGCMAYASTAGFESVCEAMWLGKPILMVPSHIEQEINAFDAMRSGAGVTADRFDLTLLTDFAKDFKPDPKFREWVSKASSMIIHELESVG